MPAAERDREKDQLEEMLDTWRRVRPATDVEAMEIVPRIMRLAYFWDKEVQKLTRSFGLERGWLDVLSALRRSDSGRLPATRLARSVLLTSGGMTARLDRMEEAGLVRRGPDPEDRRGVLVELTPAGRTAVDGVIDAQAAHYEPYLSALSAAERKRFADLLRRQLVAFESLPPDASPTGRPAHHRARQRSRGSA